jgi:hypothetical protein
VVVERKTYVKPLDKPDQLAKEARELARAAREAEVQEKTDESLRLYEQAKEKIEEAVTLVEELAEKYQGEGYQYVGRRAAELNNQAQGIRSEVFRLQMQKMREQSSGN